jgi:ferredoxin/flavodoxin
MKLLIIYFSGTGNTAFVAEKLKLTLERQKLAIDVDICPLEILSIDMFQTYDLFIFGFPTYALNSPEIVQTFYESKLSKLPRVQNKGLFLYCTMALAAGNTLRKNWKYFSEKGFNLLGYAKIQMPGSDGLAMMKRDARYIKKAQAKNYTKEKSFVSFRELIQNQILALQNGKSVSDLKKNIPMNIGDVLFGWTLRLTYKAMMKWFKSLYRADENCTRCGLCVKVCPVSNISLTETSVEFGNKCILCLRCIHQCPEEAIQLKNMTVDRFRWKGPERSFSPISYMRKLHS